METPPDSENSTESRKTSESICHCGHPLCQRDFMREREWKDALKEPPEKEGLYLVWREIKSEGTKHEYQHGFYSLEDVKQKRHYRVDDSCRVEWYDVPGPLAFGVAAENGFVTYATHWTELPPPPEEDEG